MPRITININDPDSESEHDMLTLDLPPGLTVADLKGFVEAEAKVPASAQDIFFNGQRVDNNAQSLEDAGIKDGEMVALLVNRGAPPPAQQAAQPPRQQGGRGRRGQPSDGEIETTRLHILGDPRSLAALREQKPDLAAAINEPARFRHAWLDLYQQNEQMDQERQRQIALLNEDPFNIEAQQKIEEMIRQERVIENLQHAYEHNPEVFARVTMLYIPVEVNGHPVKAFVDSGAQATIMSPSAATRCGIMRLIDTRYAGIAKGVGTARILGRVHSAEIKVGDAVMPCAFTVMEGKDVDLLFGLDMLKRYQACIDLKRNVLVLGNGEVPFLPESELPKEVLEGAVDEPVVQGPGGTEIGAKSGAVRPAGTAAAAHAGASSSAASSSSQQLGGASSASNFHGQGHALGNSTASAPSPAPAQPQQQQQQQPHSQQQQQQQQQPAASTYPDATINQLVTLGFSRDEAIRALDAADGNPDVAASFLFN